MKKIYKTIVNIFLILILVLIPFAVPSPANAVTGYKVPHWLSLAIVAVNNSYYPVAHTQKTDSSTDEARTQMRATFDGNISDLVVRVTTANTSGTSTLTFRKNGVDTALALTIPTSGTGTYTETSTSVSFSAGDLLSFKLTTSAGAITLLTGIGFKIQADDGESYQMVMAFTDSTGFSNNSLRYAPPAGRLLNNLSVEANSQNTIQHDGSITAYAVYVNSSTRTGSFVTRTRINSATGNQILVVPAYGTGLYYDDADSDDTFVAGDLLNNMLNNSSGSGVTSVSNIQMTLKSDNPREVTFMGSNAYSRGTQVDTRHNFLGGEMQDSGADNAYTYYDANGVLSDMSYYISGNTSTVDMSLDVFKNGSMANGSILVPSSTGGWFTDTSDTDTISEGDYLSIGHTKASSSTGNTTMQSQSILFTMEEIVADAFIPSVRIF